MVNSTKLLLVDLGDAEYPWSFSLVMKSTEEGVGGSEMIQIPLVLHIRLYKLFQKLVQVKLRESSGPL